MDKLIPLLTPDHYKIDEKTRQATYTEEGNEAIEQLAREHGLLPEVQSMYDPKAPRWCTTSTRRCGAHISCFREGPALHRPRRRGGADRRIHRPDDEGAPPVDGLHQAIEAKEGVKIQAENVTMASVTFQNYFRLYEKLAA